MYPPEKICQNGYDLTTVCAAPQLVSQGGNPPIVSPALIRGRLSEVPESNFTKGPVDLAPLGLPIFLKFDGAPIQFSPSEPS